MIVRSRGWMETCGRLAGAPRARRFYGLWSVLACSYEPSPAGAHPGRSGHAASQDCPAQPRIEGEWVRRALRQSVIPAKTGKASDPVARLASLNAPTADIEQMLSEIEGGRFQYSHVCRRPRACEPRPRAPFPQSRARSQSGCLYKCRSAAGDSLPVLVSGPAGPGGRGL